MVGPLDLNRSEPISLAIFDNQIASVSYEYDLTLSVTGGVLYRANDPNNNLTSVDIKTSHLNDSGGYIFAFTPSSNGFALIKLITNKKITLDNHEISAGTDIYQVTFFDLPDSDTITLMGQGYEPPAVTDSEMVSVSAQPPSLSRSMVSESLSGGGLLALGSGGGPPHYFANPSECPDFNDDNLVNIDDFAVLANNWLATGTGLQGDFDRDGAVGLSDLAWFLE